MFIIILLWECLSNNDNDNNNNNNNNNEKYAKYRQQSLKYNIPIIIVFEENSLSQFPFTQCVN